MTILIIFISMVFGIAVFLAGYALGRDVSIKWGVRRKKEDESDKDPFLDFLDDCREVESIEVKRSPLVGDEDRRKYYVRIDGHVNGGYFHREGGMIINDELSDASCISATLESMYSNSYQETAEV